MTSRTEQVVGYLIFLGTALMGVAGVAWWAVVAPVLLLAALRYGAHVRFSQRHRDVGEERVLTLAVALTLISKGSTTGY